MCEVNGSATAPDTSQTADSRRPARSPSSSGHGSRRRKRRQGRKPRPSTQSRGPAPRPGTSDRALRSRPRRRAMFTHRQRTNPGGYHPTPRPGQSAPRSNPYAQPSDFWGGDLLASLSPARSAKHSSPYSAQSKSQTTSIGGGGGGGGGGGAVDFFRISMKSRSRLCPSWR